MNAWVKREDRGEHQSIYFLLLSSDMIEAFCFKPSTINLSILPNKRDIYLLVLPLL